MNQNLDQMTNSELKQYLSDHRNEEETFRSALQVLMSRRDPNSRRQPYPFDLVDPEREVKEILAKKVATSEPKVTDD
ncbi:hypothetical protein GS597_14340 [Synechococcales cyanobacterium C]|uniref:Uncharacterized protein n=1 Tax=Petrachloros mirabilis ULC683 TaxID=2781853 RepID=A0A8K2A1E6_9CYAN|nr:hypothetical protein [Petrachloros mirabilis]NCJ07667.1 hypothetical protein [Petrachloros mirabilis ULC683]